MSGGGGLFGGIEVCRECGRRYPARMIRGGQCVMCRVKREAARARERVARAGSAE